MFGWRLLLGVGLLIDNPFSAHSQTHSPTQTAGGTVRVVDAGSGAPIPFATVGVRGRPLGTVADAAGTFPLARIGAAAADTLMVSCVSYEPLKVLGGAPRNGFMLVAEATKTARATAA